MLFLISYSKIELELKFEISEFQTATWTSSEILQTSKTFGTASTSGQADSKHKLQNAVFQRRTNGPSQLITNFCKCLTQNSSHREFPFYHYKNILPINFLVPAILLRIETNLLCENHFAILYHQVVIMKFIFQKPKFQNYAKIGDGKRSRGRNFIWEGRWHLPLLFPQNNSIINDNPLDNPWFSMSPVSPLTPPPLALHTFPLFPSSPTPLTPPQSTPPLPPLHLIGGSFIFLINETIYSFDGFPQYTFTIIKYNDRPFLYGNISYFMTVFIILLTVHKCRNHMLYFWHTVQSV